MTPEQRAEHCRRIAAHGGAATAAKYGPTHYRAIGRAGAKTTIARHGVGYWRGLTRRKGWGSPTPRPDLAADLAFGRDLAELPY